MNAEDLRKQYPDDTLPGWLREIRDGTASEATVRAALIYGNEERTRAIAACALHPEAA